MDRFNSRFALALAVTAMAPLTAGAQAQESQPPEQPIRATGGLGVWLVGVHFLARLHSRKIHAR